MSEKIAYVPLTDLNRGKASKVIEKLNRTKQSVFIVKNNKPEAVMISLKEYEDYREYLFQREVNRRLEAYRAKETETYSREDILKEFRIKESDLSETEDIEFDYE